jgi:AcrR family transcriptional regulator
VIAMQAPVPQTATAEAIIDATLQLIGEKGLKGTTTRAIAQAAGVHEVTIFRNFGTKTGLVNAAIAHRFATVQVDSVRYTGDVEADLVRLAQSYHDHIDSFGPVARSLLTEVPFDPDLAEGRSGALRLFGAIAAMLGRYQAEGSLRPEPPEALVPAFLGPIVMPFVMGYPASAGIAPEFDAAQYVNRFLHGRAGAAAGTESDPSTATPR